MKWLVCSMVCAAAFVAPASAAADVRPEAYALGAFGGWTGPFNAGWLLGTAGGAEAVIAERVGLGGEVGLLGGQGGCC